MWLWLGDRFIDHQHAFLEILYAYYIPVNRRNRKKYIEKIIRERKMKNVGM